ncbi:MAG TPA: hotdog fold thioesterase [Puia sp.]|jgi:1,4-dihydroxy-2-naphthoyl-CoA hydrolase|nr:hotdog fold thioesterase [Puia sp.]
MAIWFHENITLDSIQSFGTNTMGEHIGIEFIEIGENYIKAKMPVDHRTIQTYGLLHGGASLALAETIGSVASALIIDREKFYCVGLEINANHIRSATKGFVIGTALPLHVGNLTHVWEIKIHDDEEKLLCISRLTVAIIKRDPNRSFP